MAGDLKSSGPLPSARMSGKYMVEQRSDLESRMQGMAQRLVEIGKEYGALTSRRDKLQQVAVYDTFGELDWKPLASQIDGLELSASSLSPSRTC
jgi:uncharacterized protein YPO0396